MDEHGEYENPQQKNENENWYSALQGWKFIPFHEIIRP